jgi:hypothetical protein
MKYSTYVTVNKGAEFQLSVQLFMAPGPGFSCKRGVLSSYSMASTVLMYVLGLYNMFKCLICKKNAQFVQYVYNSQYVQHLEYV